MKENLVKRLLGYRVIGLSGYQALNPKTQKPNNSITRNGFTFVEIMLVVVIIGILASLVLPKLGGRSEQARQAAARADITAGIATALDMYELDNGQYPDSLDGLLTKPSGAINWNGPYLKKKPVDPWGRDYIYAPTADKKDYELKSYGKSGAAGADTISSKDAAGTKE